MSRSIAASENPYLPPETDANVGLAAAADRFVPATRASRLAALLIDRLYDAGCAAPGLAFVALRSAVRSSFGTAVGISFFVFLGFRIYQWSLLATTGQSLGKRMFRIRIIKTDGSQAGFGAAVVLRSWLMLLFLCIPLINLVALLDGFFIFGGERRCLHDYIAGTRVVSVDPPAAAGLA